MKSFQIALPFQHTEDDLRRAVHMKLGEDAVFRILKRSIDARQHRRIRVVYSLTTDLADPADRIQTGIAFRRRALLNAGATKLRPVVVGTGPGGIFCAYWLHLHGFQPILLEQGPPMRDRICDMARFMKRGELRPYSNICFGAGGAGTYSDGKLITRIRSPYIAFVMASFVHFGAPDDIRYLYNPHLGSNRIRHCILQMLEHMESAVIDIRYNTRFTDFTVNDAGEVSSIGTNTGKIDHVDAVFLAIGHSSRETYALLRQRDVSMSLKEFAMGVRVEHPAEAVNAMQYGRRYAELYPGIETAQYKLARTWREERRAVYSFCMCPGGYVLNASTDTRGVVTNGMSNYLKSGRFSNAAIVVNVSTRDMELLGYTGIDAGMRLQSALEETFRASVNEEGRCHVVPGQRLSDFLDGSASRTLLAASCLNPVAPSALHRLLPDFLLEGLLRGFETFEQKMRGFSTHPSAQVFGIESRTSSPYRIDRDEQTLASLSHRNLYPVGEGAGYAGGITSAAVDGIRCAEAWMVTSAGVAMEYDHTEPDATPWYEAGEEISGTAKN